jgi:hypothetical protein
LLVERRGLSDLSVQAVIDRVRFNPNYLGRRSILFPYTSFVTGEVKAAQAFSCDEQPFVSKGKPSKRRYVGGSRVSDDAFFVVGKPPEAAELIVIAEGILNALSAFEAVDGCCSVAIGSAVDLKKLHLFRPWASRIILGFDADQAGKKATAKALEILGSETRFVNWNDFQQPDLTTGF